MTKLELEFNVPKQKYDHVWEKELCKAQIYFQIGELCNTLRNSLKNGELEITYNGEWIFYNRNERIYFCPHCGKKLEFKQSLLVADLNTVSIHPIPPPEMGKIYFPQLNIDFAELKAELDQINPNNKDESVIMETIPNIKSTIDEPKIYIGPDKESRFLKKWEH